MFFSPYIHLQSTSINLWLTFQIFVRPSQCSKTWFAQQNWKTFSYIELIFYCTVSWWSSFVHLPFWVTSGKDKFQHSYQKSAIFDLIFYFLCFLSNRYEIYHKYTWDPVIENNLKITFLNIACQGHRVLQSLDFDVKSLWNLDMLNLAAQ